VDRPQAETGEGDAVPSIRIERASFMNDRNQRRLFWLAMLILVLGGLKLMGQI